MAKKAQPGDKKEVDYSVMTKHHLAKTLTPKQKIFCHKYIIDWNGAGAARAAGYSEDTARVIASELLTKPNIKAYIRLIKNDFEVEAGLSKLKVLNEVMKIAFSSMVDLHDTWIERKEFENLSDEIKACIQETVTRTKKYTEHGSDVEIEEIKIKLYSKPQAIEILNKMMGYNEPDKNDIKVLQQFAIGYGDMNEPEDTENGD